MSRLLGDPTREGINRVCAQDRKVLAMHTGGT